MDKKEPKKARERKGSGGRGEKRKRKGGEENGMASKKREGKEGKEKEGGFVF